jgi:hypothetical protein
MQHNLGFIIKQLRNDIFSHDIINLVSDFIKNRPLSNISIFTGGCDAIDTKMVPVLHISHASHFPAHIVALDLDSLIFSATFVQKQGLTYYAQSIPWANKIYDYSYLKQLFSPKVVNNILSANTDIANMYTKFFNYEPRIYEKLTYGGLYETI